MFFEWIALSIACVLRHLHTELQPPLAFAALMSTSVYLTEGFAPKIINLWRGGFSWPNRFSAPVYHRQRQASQRHHGCPGQHICLWGDPSGADKRQSPTLQRYLTG